MIVKQLEANNRLFSNLCRIRECNATCWRFTQLRGADLIMTVIILQLHSIYNVVHRTF